MSSVLQLGPFVWPVQLVIVAAAIAALMLTGRWAGRTASADVSRVLWRTVFIGVAAARLTFVWQFRHAYFDSPLDILDVRDGGWSAEGGLVAAWLYALATTRGVRERLRKPVVLAMLGASAVWAAGGTLVAISPGPRPALPDIALATATGDSFSLAAFKGRPTVVNLWATWCPPCRREMPVLGAAQQSRTDLHFVFVNQGEQAGAVNAFLETQRLLLTNVYLDPKGAVGVLLGHRALPTTLFFDADGALVATRVGELSRATLAQNLMLLSPAYRSERTLSPPSHDPRPPDPAAAQ